MRHPFCPGYDRAPFRDLAGDHPGEDVYPARDFRTEWGPIFHRGRLDGTARVLVLGQDPATHESITRRILVGEAGQRVQGLLARLGLTTGYVMINTFVYSVYGQSGGNRHITDPGITAYRDSWLDALLAPADDDPQTSNVTAVITLGTLAKRAYQAWASTRPERAGDLHVAAVKHPTYPESASAAGSITLAAATAALLNDWNDHLAGLRAHVRPEAPVIDRPYGHGWQDGDLVRIPPADLPAGSPGWWTSLDTWAQRAGTTAQLKRATITVTIPAGARTWPPIGP
jgi:uracil DNA glycosylase superfamily protein